ncbi:MAG: porin, partial [Betaproteobacteria bacterium]|nr:porin [Betaproteobacteria bacterium]
MKKSLIALACASAFAGSANAQSLTTYGIVDMGFVAESGGTAGSIDKITSGAQSGTRLGFKGTEDLGNNMKALFVLETGIAADKGGFNQNGLAFARQSFIGLQSDVGTLTLGRQYTPFFLTLNAVADPFASGLAGNAQNLIPSSGIRMDNAVKYVSPIFSGVSAEVAYGFGEDTTTGADRAGRNVGGSIGYSDGTLNVRLAHHRANNSTTGTTDDTSTMLAANYNFEVAKVFAAYSDNDQQIATSGITKGKSRDFLIGVSVPYGNHTFIASYINKDGRSAANFDASQFGLGYTYALSKR